MNPPFKIRNLTPNIFFEKKVIPKNIYRNIAQTPIQLENYRSEIAQISQIYFVREGLAGLEFVAHNKQKQLAILKKRGDKFIVDEVRRRYDDWAPSERFERLCSEVPKLQLHDL
jgi:hypothetical protein